MAILWGIACLAACSAVSTTNVETPAANTQSGYERKRETPVIAGRPARMYVWAAFDEKDCSALTPTLSVATGPTKGAVTFKPNQKTTIKTSTSGKCIGAKLTGTGIYYTAIPDQTGHDEFSITASTKQSRSATRTFQVQISK